MGAVVGRRRGGAEGRDVVNKESRSVSTTQKTLQRTWRVGVMISEPNANSLAHSSPPSKMSL